MCSHIPGPPAFVCNIEKLGVAWGQGYSAGSCTIHCSLTLPHHFVSAVSKIEVMHKSAVQIPKAIAIVQFVIVTCLNLSDIVICGQSEWLGT